jgi:hypothetical protein
MFIVLTVPQADHVRGPTAPGAALMPIVIVGGLFVLPVEVLADPDHAVHHDYLAALPQVAQPDWLTEVLV